MLIAQACVPQQARSRRQAAPQKAIPRTNGHVPKPPRRVNLRRSRQPRSVRPAPPAHDQLREALQRFSTNGALPRFQVKRRSGPVIGIDQPDQVAKHDAVFVSKPRTGHDHRCESGSSRWIAIPVGINSVCPGASVIGASMHARRSRPAEPDVA